MLEKLMSIDRRIIFIFVALAVIIPTLLKVSFPITVSQPTRSVYEFIDELSADSTILMAFNYGPSSLAELEPMAVAVLRHCFRKKVKVIGMTLQVYGATLGDNIMSETAKEANVVDGRDYVYLGFRPGSTQVLLGMGTAIDSVFETDYRNKPLSEISMMQEIKNYEQIALVLDLASSGTPGDWITYTNTKYNQQVAAGVTGVMVSELYPYIQSGQLVGLMPGLLGAAEYETLIDTPEKATAGMSVQSFVHLLVFVLVVIGNVAFFIQRRGTQ